MENTIEMREYRTEDAASLENIIRRTWHYDRFCSPKTAKRMAHLYLLNCLARQTFTQVALRDGKPVGIIMGKDKQEKTSIRFAFPWLLAMIKMICSSECRKILKIFSGFDTIDTDLLKEYGKEFKGELAFFAVDETCRGLGIGKMLFDRLVNYMDQQNIENFYLYTDSSCNYGFYEHQGMVRCGKKDYSVPIGVENQMEFYLYEYRTENAKTTH